MSFTTPAEKYMPAFVLQVFRTLAAYLAHHRLTAILVCKVIPARCPFERDLHLGRVHVHIPPMCKLNPLYDQFVTLRFHSLCFLEEHKQEFRLNMENFI